MSDATKKYSKDLTTSPNMDPMEYARREGLLPPEQAPTMQIPEAAHLAQPPQAPTDGAPDTKQLQNPNGKQGQPNDFKNPGGGIGSGVAKGLLDIVQNVWNGGVEAADAMENFAASKGVGKGDLISEAQRMNLPYLAKDPKAGAAEQITRGIVKYGAPVVATMGAGSSAVAGLAVGAGIDFATLDPNEERLSSIILNEAPAMKNIAIVGSTLDYLAKPSPGLEGRFKNVLEGLGVGAAVAGVLRGAQKVSAGIRSYREAKAAANAIPVTTEAAAPALEGAARDARIAEIAQKHGVPSKDASAIPVEPNAALPPVAPAKDATTVAKETKAVQATAEPQQLELKAFDDTPVQIATPSADAAAKGASPEAMANLSSGKFLDFATEYSKAHPTALETKPARTWSELRQESKALLQDPKRVEQLMSWKMTDRPLDPYEVDASRYLLENMSNSLVDSAEKALASGSDDAFALFAQHLDGFKYVDDLKTGAGSVAGEAFNAHKLTQNVTGMPLSEYNKLLTDAGRVKLVQDMLQKSGGKENLEQLAKQISAIRGMNSGDVAQAVRLAEKEGEASTRVADVLTRQYGIDAAEAKKIVRQSRAGAKDLNEVVRRITDRVAPGGSQDANKVDRALRKAFAASGGNFEKFRESTIYYMRNAMLSSPKTAVANFVSNAFTTANSVATKYTAAAIGRDMQMFRDANAYTSGMMSGFMEHVVTLKNALSSKGLEGVPKDVIKFEMSRPNPISSQNWGLAPEGLMGKIVDGAGEVISLPSKLSSAPDAFFGSMMYRGQVTQAANRQAQNMVDAGRLAEKDVGDFVSKFIADPPVEVHNSALEFSKGNTFASALEPGSFTQSLNQTISKSFFGWGEGIFPFFKTTANIVDYTFQHSPFKPLAAAVSPGIRAELTQGGEVAATAWAKVANGSMMLGALTYLSTQGLVTGPEPKNFMLKKALEESGQGWQPTSVKVGDKYVSLARIEPLNSYMRLAGIMSHAKQYLSEDEYEQYAVIAGSAMADFFTPEQLVENTGSLFSAWSEASQYKGNSPKVQAVFADLASRFVPAISANVRNYTDGYAATTMSDPNTAFHGAVDKIENALMNKVPWLSNKLPAQRNIFGEPLLVPNYLSLDMVSPFATSKADGSELQKVMLDLAKYNEEFGPTNNEMNPLAVSMPSRTFSMNGVTLELTPQEYDRLVMYSAGYNPDTEKPFMPPLRKTLEQTVLPLYRTMKNKEMSPALYNALVGAMAGPMTKYRETGKMMMLSDKDFRDRWRKAAEANMQTGLKAP